MRVHITVCADVQFVLAVQGATHGARFRLFNSPKIAERFLQLRLKVGVLGEHEMVRDHIATAAATRDSFQHLQEASLSVLAHRLGRVGFQSIVSVFHSRQVLAQSCLLIEDILCASRARKKSPVSITRRN